jgi:hypothetical protein
VTDRRYRVFVSHSANRAEEPATQHFLDELLDRLSACPGIETFVDQRNLQAGDEWCQRLYAWMGLCDAALILLSPRAIKTVAATLTKHFRDDLWKPYSGAQGLLAVKMVRSAVTPRVDVVINDLSRGSQPEYHLGARLFQALFPMRLPAEPSCALLSLCRRQVGHGAVIVNCHDSWTVRMMLRAATGQLEDDFLGSWRVIELPDGWGDDDESEITGYLAAELAEAMLGTGGWELLNEDAEPLGALSLHLTEFSRDSGAPILVCAAFRTRWVELAPLLAAKFPTTVFLLWSGAALRISPETNGRGVVALEPPLPAGSDRTWNLGYRRKLQLLGSGA